MALVMAMVLIMLSFPVPAAAATLTLRPSAAGDETNLTPNTGANWAAVDEVTSDGDTTHVDSGATDDIYRTDLYNLADTTLSGKGTINSVTVYINARIGITPTQDSAYTRIKTNAVAYDGTAEFVTTSYATYSTAYTTNPQSGVSWTWAEVNALQAGVALRRGASTGAEANRHTKCTQVWVVVDYTPATVWASYDDAGRTSPQDTFAGSTDVVYMEGTDFARGDTKVGYYDVDGSLVETDTYVGFAGGTLQSDCVLNQDWGGSPPTGDGTWYAVVLQTSGTMPATYAAAIASSTYVIDDDFYVANSAIPEFPTIMAAIGVAGLCFAIYYRMRKRRLAYVQA